MCDIKLNIAIDEDFSLAYTYEYMQFESEYYGLYKTIKQAKNKGFILKEIITLTIKNDSSLTHINMC